MIWEVRVNKIYSFLSKLMRRTLYLLGTSRLYLVLFNACSKPCSPSQIAKFQRYKVPCEQVNKNLPMEKKKIKIKTRECMHVCRRTRIENPVQVVHLFIKKQFH